MHTQLPFVLCAESNCVLNGRGGGVTLLRCTQSGGMRLLYSDDFLFLGFLSFLFGLF